MRLRCRSKLIVPLETFDRLSILKVFDCFIDRSYSFMSPIVTLLSPVPHFTIKLSSVLLELLDEGLGSLSHLIGGLEDFTIDFRHSFGHTLGTGDLCAFCRRETFVV